MTVPSFAGDPPILSRLLPPSGPAVVRVVRGAGGARVVALPGRCSNTYLLVAEGAVAVVDVGSRADIPRVAAAMAWLGPDEGEVRYVLPTHLHFDHVMGMDPLALDLEVPVALGATARRIVDSGHPARMPGSGSGRAWHLFGGWAMQGLLLPTLGDFRYGRDFGTFTGRNRFQAPLGPILRDGEPLPGLPGWTVLETPGHSDDAICLWHADSGFLVAGDTVRNYLGGEWNPLVTDPAAFEQTRKRLSALPVRAIFPGHGPVLQGEELWKGLRDVPFWLP